MFLSVHACLILLSILWLFSCARVSIFIELSEHSVGLYYSYEFGSQACEHSMGLYIIVLRRRLDLRTAALHEYPFDSHAIVGHGGTIATVDNTAGAL